MSWGRRHLKANHGGVDSTWSLCLLPCLFEVVGPLLVLACHLNFLWLDGREDLEHMNRMLSFWKSLGNSSLLLKHGHSHPLVSVSY
jgi:hypothetical protein